MQATYSIGICQVLFVVKDLRCVVAVWFVDICRIVDNHCLNFLFIWFCIILYWNVIHFVLFSGNKIFNKIFFPEEYVDQQFFDKYILWNLLGTNFYAKNRQVFGLYRLNQQRFPTLGLYSKLVLYRYSRFALNRFHYIMKKDNKLTNILFRRPIAVGCPVTHNPTRCRLSCLWIKKGLCISLSFNKVFYLRNILH